MVVLPDAVVGEGHRRDVKTTDRAPRTAAGSPHPRHKVVVLPLKSLRVAMIPARVTSEKIYHDLPGLNTAAYVIVLSTTNPVSN
jgi:hypothetical protein